VNLPAGAKVTLAANPDENSFGEFTGDCTGNACTLTMDAAKSVTAIFEPAEPSGSDSELQREEEEEEERLLRKLGETGGAPEVSTGPVETLK